MDHHTTHYPQQQHSRLLPRNPGMIDAFLMERHSNPGLCKKAWLGKQDLSKDERAAMVPHLTKAEQAVMQTAA